MPPIHSAVLSVTDAIRTRSRPHREQYLEDLWNRKADHPRREDLGCGNLAHGIAACGVSDKQQLKLMQSANIAIVTAHNDMLSAHQPYAAYPDLIKQSLQEMGCTGQIAAGVPAMCDGVTQGRPGMELSLLSRDLIAQCTAVGLSHEMFDGLLALGICDKIVPGLMIGALRHGHLPMIFISLTDSDAVIILQTKKVDIKKEPCRSRVLKFEYKLNLFTAASHFSTRYITVFVDEI